jgi:AcrR family transcriptional regulator
MTPRRAADTRTALLLAARRRFAEQGFAATTVRQVAADAGVDPALVIRYFGGKERLFAEAAAPHLQIAPAVRAAPADRLGETLVRALLSWQEPPFVALLRSSGYERAAELLRECFRTDVLAVLLERLEGPDAALRAELAAAQLMGTGLLLSALPDGEIARADPEKVVAVLAPAVQRCLAPVRPAPGERPRRSARRAPAA